MYKKLCAICVVSFFLFSPARAQDNTPVSRDEFNQLKKDNADMKQELADLKKQQTDQAANSNQDAQDNDKAIQALQDQISKAQPGLENFVIVGDAAFGYSYVRHTPSSFDADVSPLILWQPADSHFLVESAFDLGIGGADINSETSTLSVGLADLSYEVGDYLVVGGGLFAVPFGQFHNHFDPPWINKFPDDPLAFDAIAPTSEVGFFAKGVIPAGTTKWTYDIYASNGPNLDTTNPGTVGQLNFDDFTDLNDNKAVGGRIGFLPFPDLETGYSMQISQPNPAGFPRVNAVLQAADFHWKPEIDSLGGQFDFAAEWIWSNLSTETYDPTGGTGPTTFNNNSQGGYLSATYRPTKSDTEFVRNLEFCARWDSLQTPLDSPGGEHESRWTFGVDYWITSYCVVKSAYELDSKKVGDDANAFILQVGFGL